MFTGIIEEIGRIDFIKKGTQSAVLGIRCQKVLEGTKIGDSIAVNGVCLTAGEKLPWQPVKEQPGELRAGDGSRWTLWRSHCGWAYRRHWEGPGYLPG